ncbi:lamin tail domain-containing protein [Patescibacteria group bacterium]
MKRLFVTLSLLSLVFYPTATFNIPLAHAASPGSVVINEITWMGSADSTTDEWIELYNTTDGDIDLTNWTIDDDNGDAIYTIASGTIPGNGYFLIEDVQEATSVNADAIINISLGNTGDSLVLKDETAQTIDTVNSTGGAWFAGDNASKLTMERLDPSANGDDSANWSNNISGNGSTGRSGSAINGTPGSQNSVYSGGPVGTVTSFETLTVNPVEGDTFTINVQVDNVTDILSCGFDVLYDDTVLQYVSAQEGIFLNENGTISTSFQEGLENGTPGKIVVGSSRLTNPPSGTSGSGTLFELTFQALAATTTQLTFDSTSFLSDTSGDITATFDPETIIIDAASVDPGTNLNIVEGTSRYGLDLTWDAPVSGADSYRIMRRDQSGSFVEIANIANTNFTDSNNLIPNHTYEYQVITVKGTLESTSINGQGIDTRGVKGDNTRSDRVDGRDLDNLARHYTLALADPNFDALIDTTYDGIIDGSDLIDIGANWAITY